MVASEPMAMQPAIARQNGRGIWLYNPLLATASQISSLQRRTPFFADSSLTPESAIETPQAAALGSRSNQLADSVIPCSHPALIQRASLKEQISRRCCKCRAVIVRCSGLPCIMMTLTLSVCPAWGNPTLMLRSAELTAPIARVSVLPLFALRELSFERTTAFLVPSPFLPPRDLWGKSSGAEDLSSRWQASSRRLNAHMPRHHRRERIRLSSSPSTISVPLRLRATWSRSGWVTTNCMTAGNRGAPPTRLVSVLLLQLLSHPLTALKKKDTSICLLWMSLWPHISARPQLSDGRRGRAIRPSHAEPHLHCLDAPTRRLDKRLHSMAVLQVF